MAEEEELDLEVGADVVGGDELRDAAAGQPLDQADEAIRHRRLEGVAAFAYELLQVASQDQFVAAGEALISRNVRAFASAIDPGPGVVFGPGPEPSTAWPVIPRTCAA